MTIEKAIEVLEEWVNIDKEIIAQDESYEQLSDYMDFVQTNIDAIEIVLKYLRLGADNR